MVSALCYSIRFSLFLFNLEYFLSKSHANMRGIDEGELILGIDIKTIKKRKFFQLFTSLEKVMFFDNNFVYFSLFLK